MPHHMRQALGEAFPQHEQKKLEYSECIVNVDRGMFCPLFFTMFGAAPPEWGKSLEQLCDMVANVGKMPFAQRVWYVSCRLSFQLLHAAIMCLLR